MLKAMILTALLLPVPPPSIRKLCFWVAKSLTSPIDRYTLHVIQEKYLHSPPPRPV